MAEAHFEHTLEVPLFNRVSQRFIDFVAELGTPISSEVQVHYWHKKLVFSSADFTDEAEKKASLTPFNADFSAEEIVEFEKLLSKFASKFNCSMSLHAKQAVDMTIEIIYPVEAYLGKMTAAKLRVTIRSRTLAADLILRNFFSIVDC